MSETRITEADRLLAEPVVIEHPYGREAKLLFTNRALVETERIFGSMRQFEIELNEVLRRGAKAPILSFTARALDALLWDDPPEVKSNRVDFLELDKLGDQVEAIRRAWLLLWPEPQKASPDPNPTGAGSAPSLGASGITSPSSDSVSPLRASGT